ncbi:glycoside hydrolase family 127 protein [Nocardioides nematodiphilus]|uniref:glycoside hydrolase family 127 protein n=1 Tax=Nocardioides nematodiphilus TaxID=2849669 RepID=UPI001CD9E272|nr:beta-L-arabinofuranosidase domain-containing protein [Nocardioides nematodiphilus]MCA1983528.1 glycoside hydrolase family 127 protein [Nocardioides nematodiphilus]
MNPTTPTGGPVGPSRSALRPLSSSEIWIDGGYWAEKQQLNADVILEHCRTWMERIGWIGNFDRAAAGTIAADHAGIEFVDSEVYKLLEAMAWELGRQPSETLEATYLSLVERVSAAQEPDGYLHTSFGRAAQPPRYSDLEWGHELYCFGHLIQAAVARLRTGHDDLLPAVARRLADHLYDAFGPDGRPAVCGHPEVEMALVELGRATGEERYLELARLFVERRGHRTLQQIDFGREYFQDTVPVRDATTLSGHAVRALYLAAGAADVAVETGDAALLDAVRRQAAAARAARTYITGAVGSHRRDESFGQDFELPPDRAYAETCAGIASAMLDWRLLLSTGSGGHAAAMERVLLNNVLTSPREDGRAFFYANTLHQRVPGTEAGDDELAGHRAEGGGMRSPWFDVSCCPTNVARTLASVHLYFATASERGVQLHQYGDYQVRTEVAGGTVHLRVTSGYPYDGTVHVEVVEAPDRAIALAVRVPEWAAGAAELSGGEPTTLADGYLVLDRVLTPGEKISVAFPIEARVVHPDPRIDAVRGAFAVERGPLVLALESLDLPAGWDLNAVTADPASVRTTSDGAAITVEQHTPAEADWPYRAETPSPATARAEATLIPYQRWANRGPAAMRVWIPKD